MRSAEGRAIAASIFALVASSLLHAQSPAPVQRERYVMGTMFNIIVYHSSVPVAERAIEAALDEIVRLDRVMSHYREDSELTRLNRSAGQGPIAVDPSLYDVIERAIGFARLSDGKFDVTIAPLLQVWKRASAAGHHPSPGEIADAKRCVGYGNIVAQPPNLVRLRVGCMAIDLGGIGKGYAVEKALGILKSQGIRDAMVNAGGSTIGAIGAPPGREGWPVRIPAAVSGHSTLLLRDAAISTSQQALASFPLDSDGFGEIIDPAGAAPIQDPSSVSVVTANATAADALSTILLLVPAREGAKLLDRFPGTSAVWASVAGQLESEYGAARLTFAASR